ncbi:MAG: class I SAM-dependent methyltransferase [Gammaproteobacteria bacterium]|nr:class I SAM-dependent methyltransferase [Gammaproteobacteria bacterium]
MEFNVLQQASGIIVDRMRIGPSGVISIDGWNEYFEFKPNLHLRIDGENIEINEFHKVYRPDVAKALKVVNLFLGFSCEFLIKKSLNTSFVEIVLNGKTIWSQTVSAEIVIPHYAFLLNESTVRKREDIYGYGPPGEGIPEDILRIFKSFIKTEGKVLDFGCGRGNVVTFLREGGMEAFGIELDRPPIREAIPPHAAKFITLYDGKIPLPYGDNEFDIVTAVEVLEHIKDYYGAIREISRVSKGVFIATVPDASAIPRCFPENVVPWHLLESTHFNFFTEKSLGNTLSEFWEKITFIKIADTQINESRFACNIVAICDNKRRNIS